MKEARVRSAFEGEVLALRVKLEAAKEFRSDEQNRLFEQMYPSLPPITVELTICPQRYHFVRYTDDIQLIPRKRVASVLKTLRALKAGSFS